MKKIALTTFLFITICGNIFSQTGRKLNESEKQEFEQKIIEHSGKIQTLQCSFVQEKTSTLVTEKTIAKGILLYQSPNMLRWEYTEPKPSTLILNGNNAVLLNKDGKRMGNERMLKQLGGIIISMINGEGIRQNKQFSSEIFDAGNKEIRIILTPIQKRLKDFYSNIELKIDPATLLANKIILNEKSGDNTVILLANKELNKEIPLSKFAINKDGKE